jgi:hypothetical protein
MTYECSGFFRQHIRAMKLCNMGQPDLMVGVLHRSARAGAPKRTHVVDSL